MYKWITKLFEQWNGKYNCRKVNRWSEKPTEMLIRRIFLRSFSEFLIVSTMMFNVDVNIDITSTSLNSFHHHVPMSRFHLTFNYIRTQLLYFRIHKTASKHVACSAGVVKLYRKTLEKLLSREKGNGEEKWRDVGENNLTEAKG